MVCLLVILLLLGTMDAEAAKKWPPVSHRTGVEPSKDGECPTEHPIKGNFTPHSGERCIYHMPGQRWYQRTTAERCYATKAEAVQDGCRQSKR
ncbi:MAG: hypothetical protein QM771_06215 [Nitrospira sp.]